MLRSLRTNARLLVTLLFGAPVIVLLVGFDVLDQSPVGLMAQAFQSPIQILTSPLPTPEPPSTPPAACPPQTRWRVFEADVEVEGLPGAGRVLLRLQPIREDIAGCLTTRGIILPEMAFGNGRHHLRLPEIPDGAYYKIEIQAPPSYFRDPAGYLFQVQDGQIIRRPGFAFQFRLVPPTEQDLPPCREFEKKLTPPPLDPTFSAEDTPADTQKDVCRAERTVDISTPPKRPEGPHETGVLDVGYHYAGPMTTQDNQGVWGRNTVVDPNVPHPGPAGNRFVVERVYANDARWDHWIEAGWGEVSWRDDRQYIYEFDTVNQTWNFFDEYPLSRGMAVETRVYYNSDVDAWRALYYLGENRWRVLAEVSLGFTTADRGFNRGEVYTADGVHPILPLSGFDRGYLLIDGVWRIWDTRYWTAIARNDPYQCDMLTQYYRFNIHSPIIFIPLVLKNAQ